MDTETRRDQGEEKDQPESIPEWLKEPGAAPETASAEALAASERGEVEPAPEETRTRTPNAGPGAKAGPGAAAGQPAEPELPGWLKEFALSLHAPGAAADAAAAPAEGESKPEALPEWLSQPAPPGVEQPTATQPTLPEPAEPSVQEIHAVSAAEQPSQVPGAPAVPTVPLSEQPEWLRELEGLTPPETAQSGAVVPAPGELEPGELPEWMRDLVPRVAEAGETPVPETPHLEESEVEGLPDWLREPVAEQATEPTLALGAVAPEAPIRTRTPNAGPGAEPSERRPEWVEEFQPPAAPALAVARLPEVVESGGPLAGIRGVLPVASLIAGAPVAPVAPPPRQSAAPGPAFGVRVFESVLAEPREAPAVLPQVTTTARRLSRQHLIYLAILLAALIPFFFPADWSGLGLSVTNTPTTAFYDQVHSLAPGSTVLVSFDYDTGQAVELNPAARVVVQDLAQRGINVIALSTSPAGAQLAETVLNEASTPNWQNGTDFVNVGYIPGEEAGLRALAVGWLPPAREDFENQALAAIPLAARVKSLQDVGLVIEFAGGEDTLRWWMEQVQPRHQTTFVAVVSAAVDQQARNYVGARQLAASLRGLIGAAEYQLLLNQTGLTVRTVDAQSLTHVVLFMLILLGNLALLSGIVQKRRTAA